METKEGYNLWATHYDSNHNKTRDLEANSLRRLLELKSFENCLELGCGTGKNTSFLLNKALRVTAVDFSEKMLKKAADKITSDRVTFVQADLTEHWDFATEDYDLVTFSLVLEHIDDLHSIFKKIGEVTREGSLVYIGELHPFKQYAGTKARFELNGDAQELPCFTHHVSDFFQAATNSGFKIVHLQEFFDDDNQSNVPRILAFLFEKASTI